VHIWFIQVSCTALDVDQSYGLFIGSTHTQLFTALFPGPLGWAGARRELLDL